MTVTPGHVGVDVSRYFADCAFWDAAFEHFGDALVSEIVEASASERAFQPSHICLALLFPADIRRLL
jgi:hypothetical protein